MAYDVSNMTSVEVERLIFGDAQPWEYRSMPLGLADEIIRVGHHLSDDLKDWAWQTFADAFAAAHEA